MTPIASHIEAYLHDYLPKQRGASQHTCDTYAYGFKLLFNFASERLKRRPSQLTLEQIDAVLITDFLEHLETVLSTCRNRHDLFPKTRPSFTHWAHVTSDQVWNDRSRSNR